MEAYSQYIQHHQQQQLLLLLAEVLCDFFSSVFCREKDSDFSGLNNKKCDTVSEIPSFDLEDIIKRLKKLM